MSISKFLVTQNYRQKDLLYNRPWRNNVSHVLGGRRQWVGHIDILHGEHLSGMFEKCRRAGWWGADVVSRIHFPALARVSVWCFSFQTQHIHTQHPWVIQADSKFPCFVTKDTKKKSHSFVSFLPSDASLWFHNTVKLNIFTKLSGHNTSILRPKSWQGLYRSCWKILEVNSKTLWEPKKALDPPFPLWSGYGGGSRNLYSHFSLC